MQREVLCLLSETRRSAPFARLRARRSRLLLVVVRVCWIGFRSSRVIALLALGACRAKSSSGAAVVADDASAPAPIACPAPSFVEDVHAAAFYFERGNVDAARDHLHRATALATPPLDPIAREALDTLTSIDARVAATPDASVVDDTERLRALFADWRCLPEDTHRELHQKLPPIGAATTTRLDALREAARATLAANCGECHTSGLDTALPRALHVFDLAVADWSRAMTLAQLREAERRLGEPFAPSLSGDVKHIDVPEDERTHFHEYIVLESDRRASALSPPP
jgi:hypothetical protein